MHVADGILPLGYCAAGYAVSLSAVWAFGKAPSPREVSRMGLLAAAVFTVSFIQFPVAGASVHLGLWGMLGVLLRGRAFPVVFAALLLQTLLLQHGGLLSLGINACNMGAGALAGWAAWSLPGLPAPVRAFVAGFLGALAPAVLMAGEFWLVGYGKGFFLITGVYVALAAIEAVATVGIVSFFARSKPEALAAA